MRAIAALIVVLGAASMVRADGVFDLARRPGESVWITLEEPLPSEAVRAEAPMLRRVHGVLAKLDSPQIIELLACVDTSATGSTPLAETHRVCVIHMDGTAGKRSVVVEQGASGVYAARVIGGGDGETKPGTSARATRCGLRADRLDRLLGTTCGYFGAFAPDAEKQARGEVFEVAKPYQCGSVTLDSKAIGERIGASGYIRFDPTARKLEKETVWARLPIGYQPRRMAGLVVWVDPSNAGKPPQPLWKGLDDLGMVCIGAANSGNDRGVTERLQLALDAVGTARRRWNIDPARVYVVGVSGGGKMASILTPCFPDVFAGAVPIVGLSTFDQLKAGDGKVWPAEYSRPRGKMRELAAKIRMVAITGTKDFNRSQVITGVAALQTGGLTVRAIDVPGMGHEFPPGEIFAEQLAWVDEPGRTVKESREREANAGMVAAGKDASEAARQEIVTKWPWTDAAWEAVDAMNTRKTTGR